MSTLVLLDVSKAFDSIRDEKLLTKLQAWVCPPKVSNGSLATLWATVRVHIQDTISDALPLKYGVTQGPIVGPVLFILSMWTICYPSLDTANWPFM